MTKSWRIFSTTQRVIRRASQWYYFSFWKWAQKCNKAIYSVGKLFPGYWPYILGFFPMDATWTHFLLYGWMWRWCLSSHKHELHSGGFSLCYPELPLRWGLCEGEPIALGDLPFVRTIKQFLKYEDPGDVAPWQSVRLMCARLWVPSPVQWEEVMNLDVSRKTVRFSCFI